MGYRNRVKTALHWQGLCHRSPRWGEKKADVGEHPEVFPHVGLLLIGPPRHSLNETGRVALYLVIRRLQLLTTQSDVSMLNQECKEVFIFVSRLIFSAGIGKRFGGKQTRRA